MRISVPLLACGLLIGAAAVAAAQAPVSAPPADQAAAGPGELEATLEVALDAQPSAPAAFDEGAAYLPLKGGRLVAIDLGTGAVRWALELATTWAPGVDTGLVVVAADELLTALDARTGRARWHVPVTGGFSAPATVEEGWVLAAAASGDVLAVRAADGHVLWTTNVGAPVRARPVPTPTGVYVSTEDGRVTALDLMTGARRWERRLPGRPGPLLVLDDRLFVGADDKFFYSLDTDDGDVRWRQRVGGRPAGPPAVDDRRVFYVAFDNILWAFDLGNGGRKWHVPLPIRPSGGPLVVGDAVAVAGVSAEVHAYRAATGEPVSKFESPADLAQPPQLIPAATATLTRIAMVTRTGVFTLLSRRVEPRASPLPYPLGTEVPLSALGDPAAN